MALDLIAGFEHATTAHLAVGIFTINSSATISTTQARTGTRSMSAASAFAYKSGLSNAATRHIGAAVYLTDVLTAGRTFLTLSDGAPNTAGNVQVGLAINTDGSISVHRGRAINSLSGGTLLGTTVPGLISATIWNYIELSATVHSSAGTVDIWLNGLNVLSLTSQNTQSTANAYSNTAGYGATGGSFNTYFDDIYCVSGTGGTVTTRIGPCRVVGIVASTGDGSVGQFTPLSAADNGAMVDDPTPDDDTTYNSSLTVGFIDVYNFAAVGIVGSVKGVQIRNNVRADSGAASIRNVTRISSTNYFSSVMALTTSYFMYQQLMELNPNTGVAWTVAGVDAAEFGVEHNA